MTILVQTPKLHLVIPIYNGSRTLLKTLESIAIQNLYSTKVILLDDASTDDSLEILRNFVKKWSLDWQILQNSENKGVALSLHNYFTKNSELSDAWIMLLGQDDLLTDGYIDRITKACQKYGDKFVIYGNVRVIDSNGNQLGSVKRSLSPSRALSLNTIVFFYTNIVPSPGTAFHGRWLQNLYTCNENSCTHDWNLWLWLSTNCSFKKLSRAEIFYRRHDNNLSGRCTIQEIHKQHFQDLHDFISSSVFRDFVCNLGKIEKVTLLAISNLLKRRFVCLNSPVVHESLRRAFKNKGKVNWNLENKCDCVDVANQTILSKLFVNNSYMDKFLNTFASARFWIGCLRIRTRIE